MDSGMVAFERFTLDNGLRVVVNTDTRTPLVAMAIAYDVGARDEEAAHSGFAHLFEHLMFGGSVNVPNFDTPMQRAGGSNNAFTCSDFTCYHCVMPAATVETAFWLESDRMLSLAFTPESLEVQRKVVVEEFKQTCLNEPYGDVSHLMLDLAYRVHPYRWPTIGIKPEHIEQATMPQVKAFFAKHYRPCNAVMALSGNITLEKARMLCLKWFAPIPGGVKPSRNLPAEPKQTEIRRLVVEREVPENALFMAFHMPGRFTAQFPVYDVASDLLANGRSSRLKERLVAKGKYFSMLEASVMGTVDPGLFEVYGQLLDGVSYQEAEAAIWQELQDLVNVGQPELEKVQNKYAATLRYDELSIKNRALQMAEYELYGGAEQLNEREAKQRAVTTGQVATVAKNALVPENACVLEYRAKAI